MPLEKMRDAILATGYDGVWAVEIFSHKLSEWDPNLLAGEVKRPGSTPDGSLEQQLGPALVDHAKAEATTCSPTDPPTSDAASATLSSRLA